MQRPWLDTFGDRIPAEIRADRFASVNALFSHAYSRFAECCAFVCEGEQLTYAMLNERSDALAAFMQAELGIEKGDRIALMSPNILAFPVAMHAILKTGAAQVNVNPLYTAEELAHQLRDADARAIVIHESALPTLAGAVAGSRLDAIIVIPAATGGAGDASDASIDAIAQHRFDTILRDWHGHAPAPVAMSGDDLLFLQYTGGTTGRSKGAMLSHANLVANSEQFRAMMPDAQNEADEVLILALPLYHIFGLMMMIGFSAIGAKMVLIPNPRDLDATIAALRDARMTVFPGVNTLFQALALHPAIGSVDFSRLKAAIGGGSAVLEATSRAWKGASGQHLKEGYGLSETSPGLCLIPTWIETFTGSCGLPLPSTDFVLRDDQDRPVAIGDEGEITVRGPQVMTAYWRDPEATQRAFTDDGFFRTGDIGRIDERGFVHIVDRKKDLVIVSGFNVYPNEIEAVVSDIAGVIECACIGVPDERTGEALEVHVVLQEAATITADDVVAACRKRLAAYKVPRRIVFADELPKSNVGKILRRELRAEARAGGA